MSVEKLIAATKVVGIEKVLQGVNPEDFEKVLEGITSLKDRLYSTGKVEKFDVAMIRVFNCYLNFRKLEKSSVIKVANFNDANWQFMLYHFNKDDKALRCAITRNNEGIKFSNPNTTSIAITIKDTSKQFKQFISSPRLNVKERVELSNGMMVALYTQAGRENAIRIIACVPESAVNLEDKVKVVSCEQEGHTTRFGN